MPTTLNDLVEDYPGEAFTPAERCPICAGPSLVRHPAFNIHPKKPHRFDLRACRTCGHAWIDPMPSQGLLDHLYGRGSHSVIGAWGEAELSLPERRMLAREFDRPPAHYFELGVGRGALYRRFVQRGWICVGVDPGTWARGLPEVYPSLDEVPTATQADLLIAFDVLEHIADPVATLCRLRGIASPAARLYCAMPNNRSLRARIHREHWRMVRPLGHVNYWSRGSITHAMATAGFSVSWLQATDLWEGNRIHHLRDAVFLAIERLGLGDQWIVMATAR